MELCIASLEAFNFSSIAEMGGSPLGVVAEGAILGYFSVEIVSCEYENDSLKGLECLHFLVFVQ